MRKLLLAAALLVCGCDPPQSKNEGVNKPVLIVDGSFWALYRVDDKERGKTIYVMSGDKKGGIAVVDTPPEARK